MALQTEKHHHFFFRFPSFSRFFLLFSIWIAREKTEIGHKLCPFLSLIIFTRRFSEQNGFTVVAGTQVQTWTRHFHVHCDPRKRKLHPKRIGRLLSTFLSCAYWFLCLSATRVLSYSRINKLKFGRWRKCVAIHETQSFRNIWKRHFHPSSPPLSLRFWRSRRLIRMPLASSSLPQTFHAKFLSTHMIQPIDYFPSSLFSLYLNTFKRNKACVVDEAQCFNQFHQDAPSGTHFPDNTFAPASAEHESCCGSGKNADGDEQVLSSWSEFFPKVSFFSARFEKLDLKSLIWMLWIARKLKTLFIELININIVVFPMGCKRKTVKKLRKITLALMSNV